MTARPLSARERQAISDILSEAELEFCSPREPPPPVKALKTIDEQCKQLWPDWDPTPPRASPPRTPTQLEPARPDGSAPLRARDVDSLKAEVQRLMTRITSVSNGQSLSPAAQQFMDRVRRIAQAPGDASEIPSELLEPQQDRAAEERARSPPPSEAIATDREAKRIERENRELRKQLAAMQKSFDESQTEVAALRRALEKSEALREKMSARREPPAHRAQRARR
jgi:hypothetical protein